MDSVYLYAMMCSLQMLGQNVTFLLSQYSLILFQKKFNFRAISCSFWRYGRNL